MKQVRHVACATTPRDAVAQAAAGMDRTRFRRVGEPDILAATSGWQQGRAAQKPPNAPPPQKNAPASRGVQISSLAVAGLLGAGSRGRGLGLLRVMMMLLRMLLGVMLGLHGRSRGRRGRGSSRSGGGGGAGRGGLGGKRRDRESGRDDGGEDQLTHCNGLLEVRGSRWPGARIFRLIGTLDAERKG